MKMFTINDPEARSADVLADNIVQLKALFPEVFAEGKIDFEVLKQLLGGLVDEREEKYGLNWHGKRRARQIALTPSMGTLRPCPEESVDWDITQNLMIEGDNLEVLKLLQKSYAGKVKLVYIDPPYNTGHDFVYADDFQDNIKNYLALTGQADGAGRKLSSNAETSGRFHTDWLNMIYPRLKIARSLLRNDGAVFISCDDNEAFHIRCIMDEIFGCENFVAQFAWKARKFTDARAITNVSTDHEYIIAYSKQSDFALRGIGRDETKFSNPDNDPRGLWMSRSLLGLATREQRPNLHYDIIEPGTGRVFPPNPSTGWRYSPARMQELTQDGRILFPSRDDGRPREKKFRNEMKSEFIAFRSIIEDIHTSDGTHELRKLFENEVFSFPKPSELVRRIVEQVLDTDDLIMDFFAGSGTTGHAVMRQNSADNGKRRYLLVQLPEPLDPKNKDQKIAADYCDQIGRRRYISELTKERLRRVAAEIRADKPMLDTDVGFRVFKLDTSNIRPWDPDRNNLDQTLLDSIDHIKPDRSEQDILYELLLKLGLDLCVPIETRSIAGKTVHSIGAGTLITCLDKSISQADAEPLALGIAEWRKAINPASESTIVFRDSGFADDVAKTNLASILQQHGLTNVRSL